MTTNSNGSHLAIQPGSAIYVDTENLRESDHAQTVVAQVVANWPADRPRWPVSPFTCGPIKPSYGSFGLKPSFPR